MNKRIVNSVFCAVIALLLGFWFFRGVAPRENAPVPLAATSNDMVKAINITNLANLAATLSAVTSKLVYYKGGLKSVYLFKSTNYPPQTAGEKAMWEWWDAMDKADPQFQWKMPIEFYGKVVDQFGEPVPEAMAELGLDNGHRPRSRPKNKSGCRRERKV
ncbi:MAG: hypothetical protein WDM80_08610 [Limisphaerales bacterium]